MGFLADPYGAIELHGLAAAELDCVGSLLLGSWLEVGPVAERLTGDRFADLDRGRLYDLVAALRTARPRMSLTARLTAVPADLLPALSVVLRWSDRPGFEASAETFGAARAALCHRTAAPSASDAAPAPAPGHPENVSLPTYPATA